MAFFNNKVTSRRSSQSTPYLADESLHLTNSSSTTNLVRDSLVRTNNPFSTERRASNPFARDQTSSNPSGPNSQVPVATPIDDDVEDHSHNPITAPVVVSLRKKLSSPTSPLKKLRLREASLNSEQTCQIARMLEATDHLQELDLSFNPIGSIGAAAISEMLKFNTSLTMVDLSSDKINPTGGTMLGKALAVNQGIRRLRLSNNTLGDAGVTSLAIGLYTNTTLTALDLENNDIGEPGAKAIGAALDQELSQCQLQELHLETNALDNLAVEPLLGHLKNNKTLMSLFLTEKEIQVQVLRSSEGKVDLSGGFLATIDAIAVVSLVAQGAGAVEALSMCNVSLSGLDTAGRGKRNSHPCLLLGQVCATPKFSMCKALHLCGNDLSFSEVSALLEGLRHSKSLKLLDLSQNRLDNKTSEVIVSVLTGALGTLERLELGDNPALLSGPMAGAAWGSLLTDIRGPRNLRRLGLVNTGLKSSSADDMFDHLLKTVADSATFGWTLSWLDLRGNQISASSKMCLTAAMSAVTGAMLRGGGLKLGQPLWGLSSPWASPSSGGQLGDVPFRFCGFSCDSFDLSPALTHLDCQNSRLGVEDATLITEFLYHHKHLRSISLDGNSAIGDAGTRALASGVANSCCVENLSLRGCGVGRSGGKALLELIQQKPGIAVRVTVGNPNIGQSTRNLLEDHERSLPFGSIMARERMLSHGGTNTVAPRICRYHVLGEPGVGKRSLVASLSRGWASSLLTAEEDEDSTPALPVLMVANQMTLGNTASATWIHCDGGNLKWLRAWSDALFLVVVDLNGEKEAQHASIIKHLSRIQAAAPFNATIILVGSRSDQLGKLGEDYLSTLAESVADRVMTHSSAHGPPPPISAAISLDCRKSQSPGVKQLRALLVAEQSRLVGRMSIPAPPLVTFVTALLSKCAQEPWIPGVADTVLAPIVGVAELVQRCQIELYPGLKPKELFSILRSLHRSGAWLLVEQVAETDDPCTSFVILSEEWFMGQIIAPVSMMSMDSMGIAQALSTISSLAFGTARPNVFPLTKCLLHVLLTLNYATIVANKVMFIIGAKLMKQPALSEEVGVEDEASLASRFEAQSPLGKIEDFTWRQLVARVVSILAPPSENLFETFLNDHNQPVETVVDLFADAVVVKGVVAGVDGECMVQFVHGQMIDVVVKVVASMGDGVSMLFELLKKTVTDFFNSERTFHVTLLDDLTGVPNVWRCPPQERVAVCSNVPPSPVYVRKEPPLPVEESVDGIPSAGVLETADTNVGLPSTPLEDDTVIYRENWSLLNDLDHENSCWGAGKRRSLSAKLVPGTSSGRFELMIPHPRSLLLGTAQLKEQAVATVVAVKDLMKDLSQSAASRLLDSVGCATVVTCLSTFEHHLRSLLGMHVTFVSEVPWDQQATHTTMDSTMVISALELMHFPVYLTLAVDDEKDTRQDEMGENYERDLRLVMLATTRQIVEREEEWRLIGDALPAPISWRLVVVECKRDVPIYGVDNTVDVGNFCVAASYPLSKSHAQQFVAEHAEALQSDTGSAEAAPVEALVYVHGFLTPLCNALKSSVIFARSFQNRLAICFSWPCDPELVNHSWIMTKVMSEFERNYTHAEQHMHGSINYLVTLARELPLWGITPVWRAHSMGNYLTLNAVERLCWASEKGEKSDLKSMFHKLILDAPDVPTWFFKDTLEKITNEPHNCSVLHLFNPQDSAVEAGRMRRAIQGAYPGNALVVRAQTMAGGGEIQVVSCEGAASDAANHDYGQTDGWCLRDQKEYLAGVPTYQRLLTPVTEETTTTEARLYPIFWQLKIG